VVAWLAGTRGVFQVVKTRVPIELGAQTVRQNVGWFLGSPPPDLALACIARDFELSECDEGQLDEDDYLVTLAALILRLDITVKFPRQIRALKRFHRHLLDNGSSIIVVAGEREFALLIPVLTELCAPIIGVTPSGVINGPSNLNAYQPPPSMRYFDKGTSWSEVVRAISLRPVGDIPNLALEITGGGLAADQGQERLVRRAFGGAVTTIDLVKQSEGYSGAAVFRAQTVSGSSWPIPYFVKIDTREKTVREYNSYVTGVESAVPFHLAPRLIKHRCCLGADRGIIVGYYVTESESLLDCARSGRAIAPISCLFSNTLSIWHRSSRVAPLVDFIRHKLPTEIASRNFDWARTLGAKSSLSQLRERILKLAATETKQGSIHGDLHAKNVRVRGSDAVIIDPTYSDGPLIWDPALLEASLLVEGFDNDLREPETWLASVLTCYDEELFRFWSHEHLIDQTSWFHSAVNQIRLYAQQMQRAREADEYRAALAAALLWESAWQVKTIGGESTGLKINHAEARRGAAFLMAERLVEGNAAPVEAPASSA
jgi:hypothetical protein